MGDSFLNPIRSYLLPQDKLVTVGLYAYEKVNDASLDIGAYETVKEEAFDPYIFVRDAWHQQRENLVKE